MGIIKADSEKIIAWREDGGRILCNDCGAPAEDNPDILGEDVSEMDIVICDQCNTRIQ